MANKSVIPSSVKFPPEIVKKLKEASKKTGLPLTEIIRICAGIGLVHLEKIQYDIHGSIYKASVKLPEIKILSHPEEDSATGTEGK